MLVAKYGQEDLVWRTKKANEAIGVGLEGDSEGICLVLRKHGI